MGAMLDQWFPIAVLLVFALGLSGGFVILSSLIGRKINLPSKLEPYECGIGQESSPRQRFSVKFFITAVVFLLFDVEVTFLIPWGLLFKKFNEAGMGTFIFIEGVAFIAVLAVALIYILRKGVLDWAKS